MRDERGVSLPELLVVLAIMGVSVGVAVFNLKPVASPVQTAVALLEGAFHQARLEAMATTSAYRLRASTAQRIVAEQAGSCLASSWTAVPQLRVDMPEDVTMDPVGWSVCFSSRGLATTNLTVTLDHPQLSSRQVEVLLGGTTREVE